MLRVSKMQMGPGIMLQLLFRRETRVCMRKGRNLAGDKSDQHERRNTAAKHGIPWTSTFHTTPSAFQRQCFRQMSRGTNWNPMSRQYELIDVLKRLTVVSINSQDGCAIGATDWIACRSCSASLWLLRQRRGVADFHCVIRSITATTWCTSRPFRLPGKRLRCRMPVWNP